MLRLKDTRSGQLLEVGGRSRAVFVEVCGGGLRGLLVADSIRRALTVLHGRNVETASSLPEGAIDAADAWNIHPSSQPRRDPDVVLGCVRENACSVRVGPLSFSADDENLDPLALRLAVLALHHDRPAEIDAAAANAAAEELAGWRADVARWANSPGAPMSQPHIRAVAAAFDDDLSIPLVLQALRELAGEESVANGSKFETFAYADRLLGLDLARDIGR